ncbi:ATP-binding cassette domain-containing protein [Microbacterium sp. MM2322]|uniref:ATP-binding cassette domain-containing protein n=1 Tax=Microbacterium sp. MM2322 TaxID=3157631 RepID=UPI0032D595FE
MASATEISRPGGDGNTSPRPMVVAQNAHVTYRVYASGKRMTARDSLLSTRAFRGGRDLQTVPAVRGVSFTASEGETIGVVGHNGSGKSTLFRAMSGLIPTSQGAIWAADRPVLLGVNAALVPELSGENNIKLGLLAMGFTPEEAAAHVGEIADFAELNDFLYHPMKTYSSGMGARLRFAIASAKAHSILLIDEALAVGDRRFKLKSEQRIRELRDTAGLVMIVSHSAGSLRDTCERVLWVHKGELRADGDAKEVIDEYVRWTKQPGSVAVGAATPTSAATEKPAPAAVPEAAPSRGDGDQRTPPSPHRPAAGTDRSDPFEELLIAATVDVPASHASTRAALRRELYRRSAKTAKRRRIVAIAITGGVMLLAAAAGAAIALLSAVPAADAEPSALVRSSPSALPTAPQISRFEAAASTAECETTASTATVQLAWKTQSASHVALAGGVEAKAGRIADELPSAKDEYSVVYPCAEASWTYTLTARSEGGSAVAEVVTVDRVLPDAPTQTPTPRASTPQDAPDVPRATTDPTPEATVPPVVEPTAPAPSASPEPTSPPEETPEPQEPITPPTVEVPPPTTDPVSPPADDSTGGDSAVG